MARQTTASKGIIPQPIPHSDFRTPEYAAFETIQTKKWEATRGMSHSFAFNRNDTEADYEPFEALLTSLIEGAARGGNLLLNVGPRGEDAAIPDAQLSRLKRFGAWLRRHGGAIYGARPWTRSDGVTDDGVPVRFTVTNGALNLVFLGSIASERVVVKDLSLGGEGRLLGEESPVKLQQLGPDLGLIFHAPPSEAFAPVVSLPLPPIP
jgi:alpha-L-fucosidase